MDTSTAPPGTPPTERIAVDNIASVAMIFRRTDPRQLILETKDDGYPIPFWRNCLNFPGGNWMRDQAVNDGNTRGTVTRELREEFSLDRQEQSMDELADLGLTTHGQTYTAPRNDVTPTDEDRSILSDLTEAIIAGLTPFGDFVIRTPRSLLDAANPENKVDGMGAVCSYWSVELDEASWAAALALQKKYGNFSTEFVITITSVPDIIAAKARIAFGHQGPFQRFLFARGISGAAELPMIEGLICEEAGQPLDSFDRYLERYEVKTKPPGF